MPVHVVADLLDLYSGHLSVNLEGKVRYLRVIVSLRCSRYAMYGFSMLSTHDQIYMGKSATRKALLEKRQVIVGSPVLDRKALAGKGRVDISRNHSCLPRLFRTSVVTL